MANVLSSLGASGSRCQSDSNGVIETTMEKDVGSLQDQALKRKERLKALRDKQLHVSFTFCAVMFGLVNETRAPFC